MSIGPKIKEYRVKAGLTQKELADKLFVTYQAVSRWENDDAEPSISTLKEICRILNCTTDELFEIENKEKTEQGIKTVQEQKSSTHTSNIKESIIKNEEHQDSTIQNNESKQLEVLPSNTISENIEEALTKTKKTKTRKNDSDKI